MATLTDAHTEIMTVVEALQAAWTDYPLVVETTNRAAVDQSVQTNPYLQVTVRMIGAQQLDMADRPQVKQRGQILLSVVSKGLSGVAKGNNLLDFCQAYLDLKNLGAVQCQAFEVVDGVSIKGWWYAPAIVNFWYTRLSG